MSRVVRRPATIALTIASMVLLLAVYIMGCRSTGGPQVSSGSSLPDRKEMQPDALFAPQAELVFSGTRVPVKMVRKTSPGGVSFDLMAMNSVIEVERYSVTDQVFGLIEMSNEIYSPPLVLLNFPMNLGDTWEWKGSQTSGPIDHKAWAKMISAQETLPENGLPTIRITVDLSVDDSGSAKPSERQLKFWFAKGRGIVKRTYGDVMIRRPVQGDGSDKE